MLDENDLQAIAKLMSEQIAASESRMMEQIGVSEARMMGHMAEQIAASEARMMGHMAEQIGASEARTMEQIKAGESRMMIMMESYFDPKFDHLADGLELLKEQTLRREELEETCDRLDVLEAVVKIHSREIEKLKKAQ